MNNIKIKTSNKKTLITVVLNCITANTCCCTMHQKMARGLKFRIQEVEELHCLCSENKGADHLRGSDHEANLRLCSRINAKSRFSHAAQLLARIYYTTVVLMHTNKVKTG